MIGRPKVQPCATSVVVLAGPPVHSHWQSLTQVVVWPVGSCWKETTERALGSFASTT